MFFWLSNMRFLTVILAAFLLISLVPKSVTAQGAENMGSETEWDRSHSTEGSNFPHISTNEEGHPTAVLTFIAGAYYLCWYGKINPMELYHEIFRQYIGPAHNTEAFQEKDPHEKTYDSYTISKIFALIIEKFNRINEIIGIIIGKTELQITEVGIESGSLTTSRRGGGGSTMKQVSTPTAQPASKIISRGTAVLLSTETKGATIYYTIDGSMPTINSLKYMEPIVADEDLTIKAIAVYPGMRDSDVLIISYKVEPQWIPVESISLSPDILTLTAGGEAAQITLGVLPEDASNPSVVWKSSDPGIAVVEGGEVVPLREGTAVITAVTVDGGKTASMVVKVKPPPVTIPEIIGVQEAKDITVPHGTAFGDIPLPENIKVFLEDGKQRHVPVEWSLEEGEVYDGSIPGIYIFEGRLLPQSDIANSRNKRAKINVLIETHKNFINFDKKSGAILEYNIGGGREVIIPAYIDGVPVTHIGDKAFSGRKNKDYKKLTLVILPDTLVDIGGEAFRECTGLKSITIPNNTRSIGKAAFYKCTSLDKVDLGSGVEIIGPNAFQGCLRIVDLDLPNSVTEIGDGGFNGCTDLTRIGLGSGIESMGNEVFKDCFGITNIVLPHSVVEIGDNIFRGCFGLANIDLGEGLERIGENAFRDCVNLSEVVIPESLISIGSGSFWGCTQLESIIIPDNVTNMGSYAFHGCTGLKEVKIGKGVGNIGKFAFSGCTGLTHVDISGGVRTIDGAAFHDCIGLKSLTIGDGISILGTDSIINKNLTESFKEEYESWGAGTYLLEGGQWIKKEADSSPPGNEY
ncbi:MAG: leucine-rich repeat protein [Clostridia bacterium]|nr:leucine-rich repeat protein [Clostridia bacterium]